MKKIKKIFRFGVYATVVFFIINYSSAYAQEKDSIYSLLKCYQQNLEKFADKEPDKMTFESQKNAFIKLYEANIPKITGDKKLKIMSDNCNQLINKISSNIEKAEKENAEKEKEKDILKELNNFLVKYQEIGIQADSLCIIKKWEELEALKKGGLISLNTEFNTVIIPDKKIINEKNELNDIYKTIQKLQTEIDAKKAPPSSNILLLILEVGGILAIVIFIATMVNNTLRTRKLMKGNKPKNEIPRI
ncbi:MAG: hypothetical protein ACOYO1_00680 [Bacteroidales bacterium]